MPERVATVLVATASELAAVLVATASELAVVSE